MDQETLVNNRSMEENAGKDLEAMAGRLEAADAELKLLAERLEKKESDGGKGFFQSVGNVSSRSVAISEIARRNPDMSDDDVETFAFQVLCHTIMVFPDMAVTFFKTTMISPAVQAHPFITALE